MVAIASPTHSRVRCRGVFGLKLRGRNLDRFGPLADIEVRLRDVRFTPKSGRR